MDLDRGHRQSGGNHIGPDHNTINAIAEQLTAEINKNDNYLAENQEDTITLSYLAGAEIGIPTITVSPQITGQESTAIETHKVTIKSVPQIGDEWTLTVGTDNLAEITIGPDHNTINAIAEQLTTEINKNDNYLAENQEDTITLSISGTAIGTLQLQDERRRFGNRYPSI